MNAPPDRIGRDAGGGPHVDLDHGLCGAAILEFALVLPILLVLLGAAFELGRALLVREAMLGAVGDGVRYLARVPDPSCDPSCGPGVTRAVAMAHDQIVDNTGLSGSRLSLTSRVDPGSGTVTLAASLELGFALLRLSGFRPGVTLAVAQTERRLDR